MEPNWGMYVYLYSHGHGYHLSRWNVLADVNKACGVFSSSHSASTAVKSARNLRMRLRFWGPTRRSVVCQCHWFELTDIGLISIIQKYWVGISVEAIWRLLMIDLIYIIRKYWLEETGRLCWWWSNLYYPEVLASVLRKLGDFVDDLSTSHY